MKKQLLVILWLISFSACTSQLSQDEGSTSVKINYQIDTVRIDAGDDFIHLNWNLLTSELSPDEKYLYNFRTGASSPAVELINLESLRLEHVIPMTLDGPNRIRSPYMSQIYVRRDGFFLSDGYELCHFDLSGNKLFAINYDDHDFEGQKLPDDMRIALTETFSKDEKTLVTLYGDRPLEKSPFGFAVFDLEKRRFSYIPLDVFKELDPYRVNIYRDGRPMGSKFASIRLDLRNDSLVFSNSVKNEVGFFNLKTQALSTKRYSSNFTSEEAEPNLSNRIESDREYEALLNQTDRDVRYGRLFFDGQNNVYWRFAREMDRMIGEDSVVYKTVLTGFDSDFNQLSEILLPEDFVLPDKYFVRGGMIYTFLNEEDKVAFVRIIPNVSY
jgi:hypothetical protein